MSFTQSLERKYMLMLRATSQMARTAGFTRMLRKPPGYNKKDYDPACEKIEQPSSMHGVPASINRRTGELHEHAREKTRRLRRMNDAN